MNSGSAPHTTMSSTTMPTRSKPMVSCTSRACAMATLVPTPSVEVARTGRVIVVSRLASNRPAKPPRSPRTSGRRVRRTDSFISSTARSPASTSTPAPAYVMGVWLTHGPSGRLHREGRRCCYRGRITASSDLSMGSGGRRVAWPAMGAAGRSRRRRPSRRARLRRPAAQVRGRRPGQCATGPSAASRTGACRSGRPRAAARGTRR